MSSLACQPCLLADCPTPLVVTLEHSQGLGEQDYSIQLVLDGEEARFECLRRDGGWDCDGPLSWEPFSDERAFYFELRGAPVRAEDIPILVTVSGSETEGFDYVGEIPFYESYVERERWNGESCSRSCIVAEELYFQF
jgi:hypothetical protein